MRGPVPGYDAGVDDAGRSRTRMPGLEIPVCPRCAAENVPAETFCVGCGGPLSLVATTGPFETVLMQARAIREVGGARRPSLLVVVGAWLIGLALVLPGLCLLASRPPGGGVGWEPALATVPFSLIVGFFLWRVTTRYRASRREPPPRDEEA